MKIEITQIKQEDKELLIVFKKEQALMELLKQILTLIDEFDSFSKEFAYENSHKENEIPKERNINEIEDEFYTFEGNEGKINLIFGNKKVFLQSNTMEKVKEEIMKIIREECKIKGKELN